MQRKEIQRGDLFYYDFGKREGSVQSGERPVMVIQADNFNANKEAPLIVFKISLTTLASRLCRRWLNIIPFALSKQTITVIATPPSSSHKR